MQWRSALPQRQRDEAATAMTERFLQNIALPPHAVIAGYWPVRGEIDILPLLEKLRARGQDIALPCVAEKDSPLVFRLWAGATQPLVQGAFGIAEPVAPAAIVTPAVVLVPLAAFDGRGHRLGYGAGFYDRTLDDLRQRGSVLVIGLAYAEQRVDFLPAEATDIPMDIIVTDKTIHRFEGKKEQE